MVSAWGEPIDVLGVLPEEQQALLTYLAALTEADWSVPAVGHWRVRDVVSHLVGDNLNRLSRSRDGQTGSGPAAGETLGAFIDRLNEDWVVATGRLSPATLTELLRDSGRRVNDFWSSVDLGGFGEPVSWASDQPAPRWLDLARDYTEYWVHQQQIREATGGPLLFAAKMFAPVVDAFARALPRTLAGLSGQFDGVIVRLEVRGDAGGTWAVRAHDGGWSFVDEPDTALTVVIDQDRFWRLCIRSLRPAAAAACVSGDAPEVVLAAVQRMTSIITSSS